MFEAISRVCLGDRKSAGQAAYVSHSNFNVRRESLHSSVVVTFWARRKYKAVLGQAGKILFSFASLLLILGCVTKVNYPSEWAHLQAQSTSKACSPILGQYSQHGIAVVTKGPFWNFSDETQPSFLTKLLAINLYPGDAITHASFNLSGVSPNLSLWIGNESFLSRNFESDELRCESGNWRLDLDWSAWGSSGILLDMGGVFTSLLMHNAEDGSLVISKNQKMIGTAILLPVYIREQDWHRFPPATEAQMHPEPNAPHGVLPPGSSFVRLLPPSTQKNRGENHKEQDRCLKTAISQFEQHGSKLSSEEETQLQGRSTQAFLQQSWKGSEAYTLTEWLDRKQGHTPSTRRAQLDKPHWLHPNIADRYVLCLLDAGYLWENAQRTNEVQ